MIQLKPDVPRLSIAMATYNGAAYLQAQLDSILHQSLPPFELHVGDEGSTDGTLDILQQFKAKAPFPVHVLINDTQLGFADNFLSTAARCRGDWIVFCDQDDVWLNNRLILLSHAICFQAQPDTVLVVQTAEVVDGDLVPLGTRLPQANVDHLVPRGGHPCFWVVPGMIQTVKANLIHDFNWRSRPRDYITTTWPKQAHDKWSCMMANAIGSTLYLKEPVVLYRRHASSVTGYKPTHQNFRRLRSFFTEGNKDYAFLTAVAEEVSAYLDQLASQATPEDQSHLRVSAIGFRSMAQTMANRGKVWAGGALPPRIGAIIDNIRRGAYGPRRGYRIGIVSLFKESGACCIKWSSILY